MLIKLIPAAPHPTVLFAITFQDLNEGLVPLSWSSQLNHLSHDDLEVPKTVHSLDKAAALPCLLEEVAFDVPAMTISCRFMDGATDQWPLIGDGCLRSLEDITDDVNESAVEAEREKEREKAKERERDRRRSEVLNSPTTSVKVTRHKKQRSLLMTLVASIVPLSSQSSFSPHMPRIPSPPPTPITAVPPRSSISPRALRRRARSALVDAFRRYVLSDLSHRLPPGGYYAWVVESMLRRASDRMVQIVQQSGGRVPTHSQYETDYFAITATEAPMSPFHSDDEDEGDTDTDGSSVHTPESTHFGIHPPQRTTSSYPRTRPSHARNSLDHFLSPDDFAEYSAFSSLTLRLRQLLLLANARLTHVEVETKHHMDMLEVRSRRRAWLNKDLKGSIRGSSLDAGMAMPFKSSRLAQVSWSSDDYEFQRDTEEPSADEDYEEYEERLGLGTRRKRVSNEARLFPVSEENEDETHDDEQEVEVQFGFGVDLEGGTGWVEDEEDDGGSVRVAFDIERPQIRPRVRTSSMYKHRVDAHPPLALVSPPHPQQLISPILCQPLSGTRPPQGGNTDSDKPPMYTEFEDGAVDMPGYVQYAGDEFTLSMDLPISVRVQDRDVFGPRRRVDVDGGPVDEHGHKWMSQGGTPIDC